MDEITPANDLKDLSPLVSPSVVMSVNFQQSNKIIIRTVRAYKKLQKRWGCDELGHDLCLRGSDYVGHIQLSEEQVSIWIGEICRGQATCRYPPGAIIIPDCSRSNRNPNFDWGAIYSDIDSETVRDTNGEIGPGYFCGLALERVGATILHRAKALALVAKLSWYDRIMNPRFDGQITRRLRNRVFVRVFGIIVQETADLMRPSYPPSIRKQASNIFFNASSIPHDLVDDEVECARIMLGWLGFAFRFFGGTHSRDYRVPPEITAELYSSLASAPLHTHYHEITSNFIVIFGRQLTGSWEPHHSRIASMLTIIVDNVRRLRKLSGGELNAIHSLIEFSLQPCNRRVFYNRSYPGSLDDQIKLSITCSQQDPRFKSLSEALLDIALDTMVGARPQHDGFDWCLYWKAKATTPTRSTALPHFLFSTYGAFDMSTQDNPGWVLLSSLTDTIETTIKLVAASPDPEFSCTEIREENAVNAFIKLITHFNALDFHLRLEDFRDFSSLETASHSLLLLIATPFTGPSVLSNSYCISVLEEYR
ncbi:hypothetical protein BU17DRAFT_84401 [Hysterangium stoloniferum]|nr:hypothetical protein BU17DRAFT_84401 [Hysterangium stoloniferum]